MKYYEYTNPHPEKSEEVGDCVIRALSIATGKDWLTIYDELATIGRQQLAPMTDMKTVTAYMDKIGEKIPAIANHKRVTAKMLAMQHHHSKSDYVIRTAHHLATVKDGKLRDTWDSSDRAGYIIWRIVR